MYISNRRDLLNYFGARSLPALETQFNNDGRAIPVLLDVDPSGEELGIFTGPYMEAEVVTTMRFPVHISDFLGQVELDRIAAERRAFG